MGNVIKVGGITKLIKIGTALRKAKTQSGLDLRDELRSQTEFLLSKLRSLSPVGKTGTFLGGWSTDRRYVSGNTKSITSIRVYNDTVYAPAIEEGSAPGNSPWPSASDRTIESNGRIWSSQAIGGVTTQITDADLIQMQTALGRMGFEAVSRALEGAT